MDRLTSKNNKFFKKRLQWLIALAMGSFIISLGFPYIGEEGVYTVSSYEMWYHHHYLYPTLFGLPYWRPPLFNWLIIFFSKILGWKAMLVAARLVTAIATIGTSLMLIWLSKNLFKVPTQFSLFAALIYLTSDALFYHGWLAYSDPLFAFFCSGAIGLIWIANLKKKYTLVTLASIFLIAAFMTKALTAYVFYAIALVFIVYYDKKQRSFIIKPLPVLIQSLAFLFPLLWNRIVGGITGTPMLADILHKFLNFDAVKLMHQIIFFPFEVFLRFLPASALLVFFLCYKKNNCSFIAPNKWFLKNGFLISENEYFDWKKIKTLISIIIVNFLPYWLAPQSGIRYLLPIYPFIALMLAILLWRLPKKTYSIVISFLTLAIILKYLSLIFWFYYGQYFRGDYHHVAEQILTEVNKQKVPLYSQDSVATGLSVGAHIDLLRYPSAPLIDPVFAHEKKYLVIKDSLNTSQETCYQQFKSGQQKTPIFLIYKGKPCPFN